MNKHERELYFATLEESLLKGGAAFSEWCILIAKSIYISFINEADLATIITSVACIETYFKSESPQDKNKSLLQLINEADSLSEEEKYQAELEKMSILSVRMLLTVLFSHPFV